MAKSKPKSKAKINPDISSSLVINAQTLVYGDGSAHLQEPDGEVIWAVTAAMFPPAQPGVPATFTAGGKTTRHTVHPPPPPPGNGNLNAKHPHPAAATKAQAEQAETPAAKLPELLGGVTITTTTVTLILAGARYPGTQIRADFTMIVSLTTSSDTTEEPIIELNYTQTFGSLSYLGEIDDYQGFLTLTGPIPAGTIPLPEGGAAYLAAGTTASVDFAPGWFKFHGGANGAPVVTGNVPLIGDLNLTTLSLAASGTYDVFGFPAPEPTYEINVLFSQTGGWAVPLPDANTSIGTLSLAPGNNYDSAGIAVGEDTAGNLTYLVALDLELAQNASTQVQYNLSLASGLALLGDTTAAPIQLSLAGCELLFNFLITPPGATMSGTASIVNTAPLTIGSIALWPSGGGPCTIDFSPSTPGAPLYQQAFIGLSQALCSLPDAVTRPLPFAEDGGVALLATSPSATSSSASYIVLGDLDPGDTRALITGISMEIARPVDMMVASFSFHNCGLLQTGGGSLSFAQWVTDQDDTRVRMTVTLPPQHISEAAFPLNQDNSPVGTLGPVPVSTRMAAPTSLIFDTSASVTAPLTAALLLDWTNYPLVSPPEAGVYNPDPNQFSTIELPYKLLLSLNRTTNGLPGWVQQPAPDPAAATAPLWHARLGIQQPRGDGNGSFVNERHGLGLAASAPWSWDMSSTQPQQVFPKEALKPGDREAIVNESVTLSPIAVDHLILSTLGAWTDLRGSWPTSAVTSWTQIISQGRDQYVRVVRVGYLLPWGHVASVVEVAERRFINDAQNTNTAYLATKTYIAVAQVSRTYTQQPNGASIPRDGAISQVDILTQVTPALDATTGVVPGTNGLAFWPYINGKPFIFQARVYDRDPFAPSPGKPADTQLAAIFIDSTAPDPSAITIAMNAFNTGVVGATPAAVPAGATAHAIGSNALLPGQNTPLTTASFGGQQLALATSKVAGDTTHAVNSLTMQVNSLIPDGASWNLASQVSNFYPAVNQAMVNLPAVGLLTSGSATNVALSYLPEYLNPSTDGSNPVDAYMQLATPVLGAISGAKANGLIAPILNISGLSRTFGALTGDYTNPTAPLAKMLAGTLDPATLFPDSAKLFNLIKFSDILGVINGLTSFDTTHIPLLKVDTSDPTQLVARMNWSPTANPKDAQGRSLPLSWNDPDNVVTLKLNGGAAGSITIDTTITVPISQAAAPNPTPVPIPIPPLTVPAGAPVTTINATVQSFSLTVLDLVLINFDTMTFTSVTGKKPVVHVGLGTPPFTLIGQIDFLQVLFDAIKTLFDVGPTISIDDEAITLSFEFAVPNVGMGIFDLSNIAIGVDVILSLTTKPIEFHFHYAGPDNPFDLAVDLLGGGGFFLVDASNLANTSISLSAQAGASVSLDLGVASGSVSIMLGAFFQSTTPGGGPLIGGYVRADGQLTVLEILSIHVSFYLGVSYAPVQGILWGEASVSVEISLLFFHKTVSITFRKEFPVKLPIKFDAAQRPALHAADDTPLPPWPIPRDQIMSAADWTTYTQAFV